MWGGIVQQAAEQPREMIAVDDVRAWGNRLVAAMAAHRHRCELAGMPSMATAIEWAMTEFDGSLRGLLDGVGPRR